MNVSAAGEENSDAGLEKHLIQPQPTSHQAARWPDALARSRTKGRADHQPTQYT